MNEQIDRILRCYNAIHDPEVRDEFASLVAFCAERIFDGINLSNGINPSNHPS